MPPSQLRPVTHIGQLVVKRTGANFGIICAPGGSDCSVWWSAEWGTATPELRAAGFGVINCHSQIGATGMPHALMTASFRI